MAAGRGGSGGATGAKAPITIGFIGWFGGLSGQVAAPTRDAWLAWAKMVNAKGGINGHPVEVIVGDNGGNDTQGVAIARDFVEKRGAIALSWFTGESGPIAKYAESKSVPVIGLSQSGAEWNTSPMLFPNMPSQDATAWGAARILKSRGSTKVAGLYCAESVVCRQANDQFVNHAKAEGLQVVYSAQVSIAQPDYTAECLQMRNAGAQGVRVNSENASVIRMAQSCARQGFKPIWNVGVGEDGMTKLPEFEGATTSSPSFPWFVRSGSPAVDEYAQALQKYAPNRLNEGVMSQTWAWTSAKVLEKAAASAADKPTSQDILKGLWAMKGDALGGLAPGPLAFTFTQGKPTPTAYCVFEAVVQTGKWVAPNGLTPICR